MVLGCSISILSYCSAANYLITYTGAWHGTTRHSTTQRTSLRPSPCEGQVEYDDREETGNRRNGQGRGQKRDDMGISLLISGSKKLETDICGPENPREGGTQREAGGGGLILKESRCWSHGQRRAGVTELQCRRKGLTYLNRAALESLLSSKSSQPHQSTIIESQGEDTGHMDPSTTPGDAFQGLIAKVARSLNEKGIPCILWARLALGVHGYPGGGWWPAVSRPPLEQGSER